MSDPEAKKEFPDNKQRAAVANSYWRKKKETKMAAHKAPKRIMFEAEIEIIAAKDEDSPPTFKMKANTGRPMKLKGFYEPVIVDLSGLSYRQKTPILEDHNASRRVGHSTSVSVEGREGLVVEGVISASGEAAQQVLADARAGFPFQASIGADVSDAVYLEKGEKTTVNGREVRGPMVVAKKSSMYEVSVLALGADRNTSFSVSASSEGANCIGVLTMGFEEFLKDLGLDKDSLSEEHLATLQAKFDSGHRVGIQATVADDDDDDAQDDDSDDTGTEDPIQARREAEAAELDRIDSITEIAGNSRFKIVASKDRSKLRRKAVKEGWSPEKFELELHRARRPEPSNFAIHIQSDRSDVNAVEAALILASGMVNPDEVGKMFDEKSMNEAMSARYRGYGLHRLMHETIVAAGMHCIPGQYDHQFIRTMKEADLSIRAAGDFSTVNVTGILSNVQNKILLNAFTSGDQSLYQIAAEGSVRDFKEMTGYRMTGIGEFQKVESGGELKHMGLAEESYQIKADTFGAIIQLDRQQIINDDLNAFAQVPRAIGRAAKMKLFGISFAELLDDAAFFVAGNNNLITDVLSIDGLTVAVQAFMRQTDINDKPVDIMPNLLLTGSNNTVLAEQIYQEVRVLMDTAGTGAAKRVPAANPHVGKYVPVSTPWVDAGRTPNAVDTNWWLLSGDPDTACLEVRYLNGVRTPVIEEVPTASDVLGMRWIGYFDFGVTKKEWRGGVKSTGAG